MRLTLQQANPKELPRILLEGHVDLAIATDTLDQHPGLTSYPYYSWEHIVVVPKAHPLIGAGKLTLASIADHPIITYDEGLTGRTRIDEAFERAGCAPDIVITALDADIIKAYVAMGMGIGIIASIAFDAEGDSKLLALPTRGLFQTNTSSIAIRRGRMLRSYVYRFIELCSPELTENVVRGQSHRAIVDDYDI